MEINLKKEVQVLINKFKSQKYDEVINTCLALLKNNNNDFLWNLLGMSFQNKSQYSKSISCFKNSIKLNSNNIAALNNLGISYKNLRFYQKAETYLLKILDKNPNYINALVNLGNIKNDIFYFDEAINYYKKALKIDDKNPLIYLNLATTLQSINKIDEAKEYLLQALKIDEHFTIADHKLSLLTHYDNSNLHLKKMIEKLRNKDLSNEKKVNLYFGISKGYEDCKEYNESINYLKLGNKLQRSLLKYNKNYYTQLTLKIKNLFLKIDHKISKRKIEGKNKIFILGMPRSGTTLLEKIISSHSKVTTISEVNFIPEKLSKYLLNVEKEEIDIHQINTLLKSNFSTEYDDFINLFNINSEVTLDKTLSNFWYVGFIKILFPQSKIIHSLRNIKDNYLSIYKNLFDMHEGWLYDEEELHSYYTNYQDIMKFWNNIFKNEILNFRYEDLIKDPKIKIKELIDYCELDWDEKCLNFYKNKNPIKTLSVNQANQPIYQTSINKSDLYKEKLPSLFSKLNY